MSLDVASKKIEVLEKKPIPEWRDTEVAAIFVAVERSEKGRLDGVSNAEARAVVDLYLRTKSAPATRPSAKLADELDDKFNGFFATHGLPYGKNKLPMKERVQRALARHGDLGAQMARAPRTGSLQPLRLTKTGEAVRKDAYIDIVKKQFVVKVMDGADEPKFYGPFSLDGGPAA